MPDGGETQIAWRMGRRVYVNSRDGSSTGEEVANAPAKVRVDLDQLLKEAQHEKKDLETEKRELEQAIGKETDPAEKRQLQNELNEVNQDLAETQSELNSLSNFDGTPEQFQELELQKEMLREEIRGEEAILKQNTYDPVQIARNHTMRPEYITNLKSRLADLEAGKSRGILNSINDGVVDTGEFFAPGSVVDVIPIGKILKWRKRLKRMRKLRERLRRLKQAKKEERVKRRERRKRRRNGRCAKRGNPISVATGFPAHVDPSFILPGAIPLVIGSIYSLEVKEDGPFGRMRASNLDATIVQLADGRLCYRDEEAFPVNFDRPIAKPGHWEEGDTVRSLKLSAGENRKLVLKEERLFTHFDKYEDGRWRIAHIETRGGSKVEFTRNGDGRLEAIATSEGLRVSFRYNAADLRIAASLEGASGEARTVVRWNYDAAGNMILADAVYGTSVIYAYDARGRKVRQDYSYGYSARHSYDDLGRVVAVETNGPFNGDRFIYDDALRITTYLPGGDADKLEKFYIDDEGTVFAEANALGHIKRTEYDDIGYVAAEIDAEGNRTAYRYDPDGHIKTITDAAGRETFLYWDEDGNLEITIDDDGSSWDYEYDEKGNLVSIVDALAQRTDISNNDRGQPIGIMRHDGLRETREYDDRGNLIAQTDFRGAKTQFSYDTFNRITAITNALGEATKLEYPDQPGHDFWRPGSIVRPDGAAHTLHIDRDTAETRITDSAGRTVVYRYGYGPGNLLTEMEDPQGGKLRFFYDGVAQLIAIENQKGLKWTFERDGAGRVIRETDFSGLVIDYTHDAADRVVEAKFADGTRTAYEFDGTGLRTTEAVFEPGASTPQISTYRYDSRGLIVGAQNHQAAVTFERDGLGRITAETVNSRRIDSAYDCCGNRTERRIGERLVSYAYDPMGALSQIAIDNHLPLDFRRDQIGQEMERRSTAGFVLHQAWDKMGQVTRQIAGSSLKQALSSPTPHEAAFGFTPGVARAYQWSQGYEPVAVLDVTWGETRYDYDGNGQVIQSRFGDGGAEDFTYDKAQNLVASGGTGGQDPASAGFLQWLTAKGGRPEEARGPNGERVSFRWDVRGRVIERRVERNGFRPRLWRYRWDGADRLVECETPEGLRWQYGYDPFGRRLWKRIAAGEGTPSTSESKRMHVRLPRSGGTLYLWDGDNIAEETPLGTDGAPLGAIHWHYEPGGFRPLARQELDPEAAAGSEEELSFAEPSVSIRDDRLSYVVTDHVGSPRELFSESGVALWAAEYTTWGSIRRLWAGHVANDNRPGGGDASLWLASDRGPSGGTAGPGDAPGRWFTQGNLALKVEDPETLDATQFCPIRFQGQWEDDEAGLTYNRYRYYDNLAACYVTPDPLGIRGGPRPHGYVDNPLNEVDPAGLSPFYGPLDGHGRPTGVWATLTSKDLRPTGSSPPTFDPPGFISGKDPHFQQRSHLLADTLGGSGSDARNLVTLSDGSNHPGMSRIEGKIRKFLRENPNCSVTYVAIPMYNGSNLTPTGVAITARTSAGEMLVSTFVPNGLRQNRK